MKLKDKHPQAQNPSQHTLNASSQNISANQKTIQTRLREKFARFYRVNQYSWPEQSAQCINQTLAREKELLLKKKDELKKWDFSAKCNFAMSFGTVQEKDR